MVFEIVEKMYGTIIGRNEVSVTNYGFSFGENLVKVFDKGEFIEVYFDLNKKKVGFKSTKNNVTGFKLQRGKRTGQLTSPLAVGRLDRGVYEAKVEDGMLVINVPKIKPKQMKKFNLRGGK